MSTAEIIEWRGRLWCGTWRWPGTRGRKVLARTGTPGLRIFETWPGWGERHIYNERTRQRWFPEGTEPRDAAPLHLR